MSTTKPRAKNTSSEKPRAKHSRRSTSTSNAKRRSSTAHGTSAIAASGEHEDWPELHPRLPALTLANAHFADFGTYTEAERPQVIDAIMMAAQHLADFAEPGQWECFDAKRFARQIDFIGEYERLGIWLILMGFFVWMALYEWIEAETALKIFDEIARSAPPSPLMDGLLPSARNSVLGFNRPSA